MADLGKYFTNLIAEHDGIKPEEVTPEHIHDKTEQEISFFRKDELGLTNRDWNKLPGLVDSFYLILNIY